MAAQLLVSPCRSTLSWVGLWVADYEEREKSMDGKQVSAKARQVIIGAIGRVSRCQSTDLCERGRINNLKIREPMEISVPGTYAADTVFTHEDSRVGVVEEIA
jgi:hypothetical protein